jgi:hypothetical protein
LEYWKRKNNELNYYWGMTDFEHQEVERPDFIGEERLGIYHMDTWVAFDPEEKYGFALPAKNKYYPSRSRVSKMTSAFPILATMLAVVVVATFATLTFRLFVQNRVSLFGAIVGGIVNAIVIIVMNLVWKIVATKLTDWENHRTHSEYENNLIFKIFLFYFVNSYICLYYIAFFKNGFHFFNSGSKDLEDGCKSNLGNDGYATRSFNIISGGCVDELTLQLITILATNITIGQAREVAIPWLVGKLQIYFLAKKMHMEKSEEKLLPPWEKEGKKPLFPGTFDEYSEMIIQYGYITLFAAAFPLAPLLAVLNNVVEIRTDAFKLLTAHTRPRYQGAQNIGTWFQILEVLGVFAVITNCLLIGFSFNSVYGVVLQGATGASSKYIVFWVFAVVVGLEHFILFVKFLISILVPDVPGWIRKQVAKEDYIKQQTLKKLKGQKLGAWKEVVQEKDEIGEEV